MKHYTSSSLDMPIEWDLTSSKYVVYHNYNIQIIPEDEHNPLSYSYNVDEYTRMEYLEYQNQLHDITLQETDNMLVNLMYDITLMQLDL